MSTINEAISALRVFRNVILEGPPGTGKSFSVADIAASWTRPLGIGPEGSAADGSGYWSVTFHPSTGYEEFVEGIRYNPVVDSGASGPRGFELLPGVFRGWVDAARSQPDMDFIVLIDEVNRANVSKVLGDLLLGLESSKRQRHDPACKRTDGAHTDCWGGGMPTRLAYSGIVLGVPDNIYVLGTMNSSDRSIAPLDSALRRRFAFVRVSPLSGGELKAMIAGASPSVGPEVIERSVDALDALNLALFVSLGPDSRLGHSYLFEIGTGTAGGRRFWMEVDAVAVSTGSQLQVTKDWANLLLSAVVAGTQLGSRGTSAQIDVTYDGAEYSNVILENPNSGNIRFSANSSGLPFSKMNDGVTVWIPAGIGKLRLEYVSASGADRSQSVAEYEAISGWKGATATRKYGAYLASEDSRGDAEEKTVWRYSVLPQLIDTVTQAYAPDLLLPELRENWLRESLPVEADRADVLAALKKFDTFLHDHLGLDIVRAGHGLTAGLIIEESAPALATESELEVEGLQAQTSDDSSAGPDA